VFSNRCPIPRWMFQPIQRVDIKAKCLFSKELRHVFSPRHPLKACSIQFRGIHQRLKHCNRVHAGHIEIFGYIEDCGSGIPTLRQADTQVETVPLDRPEIAAFRVKLCPSRFPEESCFRGKGLKQPTTSRPPSLPARPFRRIPHPA